MHSFYEYPLSQLYGNLKGMRFDSLIKQTIGNSQPLLTKWKTTRYFDALGSMPS
jgi:hypothetical protein